VLFDGATQSACGVGRTEVSRSTCPADRKVYLDLSFFRELDERFGASGDFAQAYVVAHEVGHHAQNMLGISEQAPRRNRTPTSAEENALSVRLELQAIAMPAFGDIAAQRGPSTGRRRGRPECRRGDRR
jgi:predicted metalloprotease